MSESTARPAVLGLDTSTATAVAASIARSGEPYAERRLDPAPGGRPRHANALLEAVEECAAAAGGWERVGRLAVGIGPGAFTGLRVGIATARGLAQALEIPVAPVVSLAALARGLDPGAGGEEEFLLAALDARRGELFAALYHRDGRELRPPFGGTPDRVAEVLREAGGPVLAGGDGTVRFRAELEQAGARVIPDGDPRHTVSARQVCVLGRDTEAGGPESIEPIYLRRPDAELWRERNRDAARERSR